jgi:hypothetical protein
MIIRNVCVIPTRRANQAVAAMIPAFCKIDPVRKDEEIANRTGLMPKIRLVIAVAAIEHGYVKRIVWTVRSISDNSDAAVDICCVKGWKDSCVELV